MSKLEKALESLDDRAKSGKTASVIIDAARASLGDAGALIDEAHEQVREASSINDRLRDALKDAQKDVERLSQPRVEQEIEGPVVRFRYKPAMRGDWRLAEIESALTHLRIAGGGDDTQVRVTDYGALLSKLADEGNLPSGWTFTTPEPEKIVVKAGLPIATWLAMSMMFVGGVFFSSMAFAFGVI